MIDGLTPDRELDAARRRGPVAQRVARNIQDLRERQRLTQAVVVERLREQGMPMLKTTLSKIENGQRPITADELAALASVLRVSPMDLLGEGPTPLIHHCGNGAVEAILADIAESLRTIAGRTL